MPLETCWHQTDVTVGSALVDMYAKSGFLNLSRKVFDEMPNRNVSTWNVLIMAYGMHGKGEEALELFKKMEEKPNEVTFIALFASDHYACVVDLLGRTG